MSKKEKTVERLEGIFKHYKKEKKLFVTSDGNVFTEENEHLAKNFSARLQDRKIETYDRDYVLSGKAAKVAKAEAKKAAEAKKLDVTSETVKASGPKK